MSGLRLSCSYLYFMASGSFNAGMTKEGVYTASVLYFTFIVFSFY